MTVPSPLSDDDDLLAAELAFGLLDPADRALAEKRMAEPAFTARARHWTDHAATLLEGREAVPSPAIWAAILASLPSNGNRRADDDVRASLRFWRAATGLSAAAALVFAVLAMERKPMPPPAGPPPVIKAAPSLIATLAANGRSVVTISFDPASGRLISAPSGLALHGHAAELWVIPGDGTPRSLGVIAASAPGVIRVPAAGHLIAVGATMAISVEPRGGSTTGLPTGPVILTGKVVAI
jgi:anti-sigma-K factor RskA